MNQFTNSKRWRTLIALAMAAVPSLFRTEAAPNRPPRVSIVWPRFGDQFSAATFIKIKAEATDPDGFIAQVQFFAGTNLIATVTNAPFNTIWEIGWQATEFGTGVWDLKAVATDNTGATNESPNVRIGYYTGRPPSPVLLITSPPDGTLFPVPATFNFSAEFVASLAEATGRDGVEFFVDTNSVGLTDVTFGATAAPSSVTVSNLSEGEHVLSLRSHLFNDNLYHWQKYSKTIRMVKLGVRQPTLTADGRLEFEIVTSFPGQETVIQASPDLLDWVTVGTEVPLSNTFTFTTDAPAGAAQSFYRVLVQSP